MPDMTRGTGRAVLLACGCVVLGLGVALLLLADLGSDGFSTLVRGVSLSAGVSFAWANLAVSAAFLTMAALRRVRPGIGTVVQVLVVGLTVTVLLGTLSTPASLLARITLLALALPVISVGIAAYLGAHLGAGPVEAAALAWDPPLRFRWSYSALQLGAALLGWSLGATVGVGTLVVVVLLGPGVDLAGRLLRLPVERAAPPR